MNAFSNKDKTLIYTGEVNLLFHTKYDLDTFSIISCSWWEIKLAKLLCGH